MKIIAPLILLACLAGCGHITTYYPDGQVEADEWTLLKDTSLSKFTSDGHGAKTIEGGAAKVNVEATRVTISSVVEGAVRAFVK